MGVYLTQIEKSKKKHSQTIIFWVKTLYLARDYGWKPGDEWALYFANGQKVKAEDAYSLADALERAMADIPDHNPADHGYLTETDPGEFAGLPMIDEMFAFIWEKGGFVNQELHWNPKIYFANMKLFIVDLIAFFREGAFTICYVVNE